jgi:hypothetical protein
MPVVGPAIVDLSYTAVSVAAGHRLRRDDIGNLVLTDA